MAKAGTNTPTIIEHCRISPPPHLSHSLPLTFLDIIWLNRPPISRIYFYNYPSSTMEFQHKLLPHLKNSLSSVLKHYLPFSGNLITPTSLSTTTTTTTTTAPVIRYLDGDSVCLTVAEFTATTHFKHLLGLNHQARDVDQLFALVPHLPPPTANSTGVSVSPVLSIQITLFPDHGFSIGFTNSHVVADGKTMSNFVRTWASLNAKQLKLAKDKSDDIELPLYDKSLIKDPKGIASMYLKTILSRPQQSPVPAAAQTEEKNVQSTFIIPPAQIQGLKQLVSNRTDILRVSSFVVTCAYVWSCVAKTRAALGENKNDEDEVEYLIFSVDVRARLDPPIPETYFGNAVISCWANAKTSQLAGEEGVLSAVKGISEALDTKLNNEEGVFEGAENFFDMAKATGKQRKFGFNGSPKFDYYSTDFGWGKPIKYEAVAKKFGVIGLSGSRDLEGGLEVSVTFSENEMDVFTTIFTQGLIN